MDQNNNTFAPNQNFGPQPMPQPNMQPAQPAVQPAQPAQTPQPGVNLESPILSPTHYGDQAAARAAAEAERQKAEAAAQAQQQANPEKSAKRFMILAIILGIVAVIGVGLGAFALVDDMQSKDTITALTAQINTQAQIIGKVEADTGTKITSVESVPAYAPVSGNIYISEWGIRIPLATDITDISYILDQKYRPQICFTAVPEGMKYFPSFADIDQNRDGMGCLTKVATSEGDIDSNTGISFGNKVYTYGEYSYFYTPPDHVFATDAAEQGLEATAVQSIKNMLSNVSHYE